MNRDPIILPIVDDQQLRNMIDRLITPENADKEVSILYQLLLVGSEDEGRRRILEYAFTKTSEFENSFQKFMRLRPTISISSRSITEAGLTM